MCRTSNFLQSRVVKYATIIDVIPAISAFETNPVDDDNDDGIYIATVFFLFVSFLLITC